MRTDLVDLGENGGAQLNKFLKKAVGKMGISLIELAKRAYQDVGTGSHSDPYGTIKQWCRKRRPQVELVIFEAVLRAANFSKASDYPHLPDNERTRLKEREAALNLNPALHAFVDALSVVDLSHQILQEPSCGFRMSPAIPRAKARKGESGGIVFTTTVFESLPTNYGTHIDFPAHLYSLGDSRPVSNFPLDSFVREAFVVDIRDHFNGELAKKLNEEQCLPIKAFGSGITGIRAFFDAIMKMEITKEQFLAKCPHKIRGKALLFHTGLDRYWVNEVQRGWQYAYFLNPFLSTDLANYFANEGVSLIGSDSLQLECPLFNITAEEDFPGLQEVPGLLNEFLENRKGGPVHNILLGKDICLVENLTNLGALGSKPVLFVAAPLKFGYPVCDNSPTRAFALVLKAPLSAKQTEDPAKMKSKNTKTTGTIGKIRGQAH